MNTSSLVLVSLALAGAGACSKKSSTTSEGSAEGTAGLASTARGTVPSGGSAGGSAQGGSAQGVPSAVTLKVTSAAFEDGGEIPKDFTCEGVGDAPPLAWSGAPAGTRSFAITVDDPDAPDPAAPERDWVHWVIAALPAGTTSLARAPAAQTPAGATMGKNDWGKAEWGGPCPPTGRHRYFFRVYALDTTLSGTPTKSELEQQIKGHVLAQGELVGTYAKH